MDWELCFKMFNDNQILFIHHLMQTDLSDLTAHEFREDVLSATLGGNTDFPESTLDALMQAMVGLNDHIIIEDFSF